MVFTGKQFFCLILSFGISIQDEALVLTRLRRESLLDKLLDVLVFNAIVVLLHSLLDLVEQFGVLLRFPTVLLFAFLAGLDARGAALQLLHRFVDHLLQVHVMQLVVAAELARNRRLSDARWTNDEYSQRLSRTRHVSLSEQSLLAITGCYHEIASLLVLFCHVANVLDDASLGRPLDVHALLDVDRVHPQVDQQRVEVGLLNILLHQRLFFRNDLDFAGAQTCADGLTNVNYLDAVQNTYEFVQLRLGLL